MFFYRYIGKSKVRVYIMNKLLYEKPLLIDLKKNDAMFGFGADCTEGAHGTDKPGACRTGVYPTGTCSGGNIQ